MGAVAMVVSGELRQQGTQVTVIDHDQRLPVPGCSAIGQFGWLFRPVWSLSPGTKAAARANRDSADEGSGVPGPVLRHARNAAILAANRPRWEPFADAAKRPPDTPSQVIEFLEAQAPPADPSATGSSRSE